ncbi:MAG: hypothetical protein HKN22_05335, partial [Bacteroidia bacterium]|nr:hypothetical protein [Bacteroidia bacterium]
NVIVGVRVTRKVELPEDEVAAVEGEEGAEGGPAEGAPAEGEEKKEEAAS